MQYVHRLKLYFLSGIIAYQCVCLPNSEPNLYFPPVLGRVSCVQLTLFESVLAFEKENLKVLEDIVIYKVSSNSKAYFPINYKKVSQGAR